MKLKETAVRPGKVVFLPDGYAEVWHVIGDVTHLAKLYQFKETAMQDSYFRSTPTTNQLEELEDAGLLVLYDEDKDMTMILLRFAHHGVQIESTNMLKAFFPMPLSG